MRQWLVDRLTSLIDSVLAWVVFAAILALGAGSGIAIWALIQELSAALVTAMALAVAALIVASVSLALTISDKRAQRHQKGEGLPKTSIGTSTAEVSSDDILWRHNGVWQGSLPHKEALCPDHRVPLMAWIAASDNFLAPHNLDIEHGDELWCMGREDSERHKLKLKVVRLVGQGSRTRQRAHQS